MFEQLQQLNVFFQGKKTYTVGVITIIMGLMAAYGDYKMTHTIGSNALTQLELGFGMIFLRKGIEKQGG